MVAWEFILFSAEIVVKRLIAAFFMLSGLLVTGWANAEATITFSQVGNDVQATISGRLDVTTAGPSQPYSFFGKVRGAPANVVIGQVIAPSTRPIDSYSVSGPTNIGTSTNNIFATSGSGTADELFGVNMTQPARLIVPSNFTSGVVSASSTWAGQSIASLGLTPGTYTFTWTGDTLRIIIPASAPTATTNAASLVTANGATLNGTVSANGASTTVTFEYVLTSGYGSTVTATQSPLSSSASTASVSAAITGLTCNMQYHFRVDANNGTGGTINGSDAILTTSACPAPTLSVTNSPQTYTGSPIAATVTCSSGGAVSNVQYNSSGTLPINVGTYAVTANCAANVNYSALTGASAGNFVINAAPSPAPIPTLSEWAQIMMMFLMILTVGWHFRKQQN